MRTNDHEEQSLKNDGLNLPHRRLVHVSRSRDHDLFRDEFEYIALKRRQMQQLKWQQYVNVQQDHHGQIWLQWG